MNIWTLILIILIVFPLVYTAFMHIMRYRNEKDILDIDENLFFERYAGAVVEHYSVIKDEHYILKDRVRKKNGSAKLHFPTLRVKGVKKRVLYLVSFQKSADEIYAFYLQQFERKNYKIIYSVFDDEFQGRPGDWLSALFLRTTRLISGMHFAFKGKMLCYISGVRENNETSQYATVFVVNSGLRKGFTGILVQIIEPVKIKEPAPASSLN